MSDEQRAHVQAFTAPAAGTSRDRDPAVGDLPVVQPCADGSAGVVLGVGVAPYAGGGHRRASPEARTSAESTYRFAYEPAPECVRQARSEVEAVCQEHALESFGPVLVASELMTNALQFAQRAGAHVVLTMHVNPSVMLVEVADPAIAEVPDLDMVRPPSDAAISGRGLLLAKAVADGLEVVVHGDCKAICARFERGDAT